MQTTTTIAPLIPRNVLAGNPERDAPRISPDGTMFGFRAPSNGKMSVWVSRIDGTDARVVAHDPARPIPWFAWQGDGRHIIYLQDCGGDEDYHVFSVSIEGGAVRDLTPGEHVHAEVIAIDHRFPDTILIASNARESSLMDVVEVDLASGVSVVAAENPGDVAGWLADRAFVVRAAIANHADGSSSIRVRNDAQSPWRTLDEFTLEDGTPSIVAFSPDNTALYAITSKDWNAARLVCYDLASGTVTPVLQDEMYSVAMAYCDPATNRLMAAAVLKERLEWEPLEADFAGDLATLERFHPGDLTIQSASADGNVLIVSYLNDVRPTAYVAYDRRSQSGTFLFYTRPQLAQYALSPMTPFQFTARDGLNVHGYLTLPAGEAARLLPAIMLVHGGPWHRDTWGFDPHVQWLANRGYAVVQVNFRGSTGYGKAFLNAGNLQWAGTMRTDLLDARDWAIEQGIADPHRFAIMGGSYGGYAVLAALTFTPDAFTCGIDLVGPSNLNTLLGSIPPYWKPMLSVLTQRVGEDPAFLDAQSPLFKAAEIRSPLLIAHGSNDPRVKQQESDQIVAAMRGNGVPVTYLVFEDEGHGFANPENDLRFMALAEAFLGEHLGGRVEAASPAESIESFLR